MLNKEPVVVLTPPPPPLLTQQHGLNTVKTPSRPEGGGDDESRIGRSSNSESGEIVGPSKVFSQQETAGEKG
ncbi:unnamed protein product [Boreogadus saida]